MFNYFNKTKQVKFVDWAHILSDDGFQMMVHNISLAARDKNTDKDCEMNMCALIQSGRSRVL